MNPNKTAAGALLIIAIAITIVLSLSFFIDGAPPENQVILLIYTTVVSVTSGFAFGASR